MFPSKKDIRGHTSQITAQLLFPQMVYTKFSLLHHPISKSFQRIAKMGAHQVDFWCDAITSLVVVANIAWFPLGLNAKKVIVRI